MRTYGKQGVSFSEEYFTEETLSWLLQPPAEKAAPVSEITPVEHTPESAYAAAWTAVMQEPELKQVAEEAGYTQEKGLAEFLEMLEAPLPEKIDEQMAAVLKVDYVSRVEDGKYVHRINGESILAIPTDIKDAATISLNIDAVFYGLFSLIDIFLIMCALCHVIVSPDKRTAANKLKGPLRRFLIKYSNPAYIAKLREWKTKGWYGHMMVSTLATLNDTADSKSTLETILDYLTPIQIIGIVLKVAAYILLAIASGGTALGYRLATLAAMVAFFIGDFLAFIKALGLVDDQPIIPPPPPPPPGEPEPPEEPPEAFFGAITLVTPIPERCTTSTTKAPTVCMKRSKKTTRSSLIPSRMFTRHSRTRVITAAIGVCQITIRVSRVLIRGKQGQTTIIQAWQVYPVFRCYMPCEFFQGQIPGNSIISVNWDLTTPTDSALPHIIFRQSSQSVHCHSLIAIAQ